MIESLQNIHIKQLTRFMAKNAERRESGIFIVEGAQENARALQNNFVAEKFFVCQKFFSGKLPQTTEIQFVSEKVYEKIAYRGTTEGIIGVFQIKNIDLQYFIPEQNSIIIVIESVEKPGNLGAILRSCEAFGIDAVIVTDCKTDFYNPNVIRSSIGCLFGMNFFTENNQTVFEFLIKNNFRILTTFMNQTSKDIQNINFQGNNAIIFGTEHSGLSKFWQNKGINFQIPMCGTIDSLNLSNAVAISCYQATKKGIN